jgi:quercetin dioxygenase-like cupin family protein
MVVAPGEHRAEFGCFRIGASTGLIFNQPQIYWHLEIFPSRAAAEAAKTSRGVVVEEDGKVWLSEFGPKDRVSVGGNSIAVVGPLTLISGKRYDAEIAYSVMGPDDHSRVHTHAGPEAWFVLAGEQCLDTPGGGARAHAGETMTVAAGRPMELSVIGNEVAKSMTLVIHDSTQDFGAASDWHPTGACRAK